MWPHHHPHRGFAHHLPPHGQCAGPDLRKRPPRHHPISAPPSLTPACEVRLRPDASLARTLALSEDTAGIMTLPMISVALKDVSVIRYEQQGLFESLSLATWKNASAGMGAGSCPAAATKGNP